MEDLTYHLEGILKTKDDIQDFEGPLTLILMLLQKNKIEIRDIVISDILDQYTEYLNQMEKMDLEIEISPTIVKHKEKVICRRKRLM